MQKIPLLVCLLAGFSLSVWGQKVTVYSVTEQRTTADGSYNNRCDIELEISGDEVRKYKFLKILKLSKAIDDQGLDLLMNEEDNDFE